MIGLAQVMVPDLFIINITYLFISLVLRYVDHVLINITYIPIENEYIKLVKYRFSTSLYHGHNANYIYSLKYPHL